MSTMLATPANHDRESTQPTCQNCSTSTTPLWRRDEYGSVLCNACGLFLKLHGRPRPISLKTDVIKSRNRVKTMRPDLASKKKQQQQQQQQAQQAASGIPGATESNDSRTATPALYDPNLPVFPGIEGSQFQAGSLPGFNVPGESPNRPASPLNGERNADVPQTHEQLIAANSALKTRVSELEVVVQLFRGQLSQVQQEEANARRGQEISGQVEAQLRTQLETVTKQLEESHRRENVLKRRLDELDVELKEAKDALDASDSGRASKKLRVSDMVGESEAPPPQTAS